MTVISNPFTVDSEILAILTLAPSITLYLHNVHTAFGVCREPGAPFLAFFARSGGFR
jgi:hypothetical protein